MLTAPTNQTTGRVAVMLPPGTVGKGSNLQIPLPQTITTRAQQTNAAVTATLENNQPLPNWIRFDPGLKTFTITANAQVKLPIALAVSVGSQRSIITVSESAQP